MPIVPQAGDFGITAGGGAPMWAVRLGTMSRYGHACICSGVGDDGLRIIEPMPGGCRRRVARAGEFVWSDVDLDPAQRAAIIDYAATTVGIPYDWPAIAGFVARFWGAKVGIRGGDRPASGKHLMCSEMVVRAYRAAGVDMAPGKPAGSVSPGDLDQWLDDRRRALNRRAGK